MQLKIKSWSPKSWLLVSILYVLAELWINPTGEYTLNDDWSYSKAVADYIHLGKIKFSDYIAVPFIVQFWIGVGFAKLFGFSFFVLRLSSFTSVFGSLYLFDKILDHFTTDPKHKRVILLFFVFQPLYFSLSSTFMPEMLSIFFLLFAIWAFFKIGNKIQFQDPYYMVWIVACICMMLIRQTGLLLPLIAGIVGFILSEEKRLKKFFWCFLPFVFSFLCLKTYEYIMESRGLLPGNFNLQLNKIKLYFQGDFENSISLIGMYVLTSFTTIGCFVFPLVVRRWREIFLAVKSSKLYSVFFITFFILMCVKVFLTVWYMPFVGNMFWSRGIGPVILTGFNSDKWIFVSGYGRYFFGLLSLLGAVSFFFMLVQQIEWIKKEERKLVKQFRWIVLLLVFGYVFLVSLNYANDRYILFLVPLLLLICIKREEKILNFAGIISGLLLILFGLFATKDYFSFHEARGQAVSHLLKDLRIRPEKIDGGFEFNGYYTSEFKKYNSNHNTRWWWIVEDEYIISVKDVIKGYEIESVYPVRSYISYPFEAVRIFKRK